LKRWYFQCRYGFVSAYLCCHGTGNGFCGLGVHARALGSLFPSMWDGPQNLLVLYESWTSAWNPAGESPLVSLIVYWVCWHAIVIHNSYIFGLHSQVTRVGGANLKKKVPCSLWVSRKVATAYPVTFKIRKPIVEWYAVCRGLKNG
jgi:hypothetical protein